MLDNLYLIALVLAFLAICCQLVACVMLILTLKEEGEDK
jgi:hypothetical protein